MAKFYGVIGYNLGTQETTPGVWEEVIVEKRYPGDWIRNTRKLQGTNKVNDDINISNELSIIADAYANEHYHMMRYVEFMGAKWKILSVEVQHPRLQLTLGGVYNVEQD